ncbi:MAG: hypothetical protein BMS9Abin37_0973 [Acidobacteriota bacterium]|nr:MAG: hypothetical protein BMS9Abin37_0973 [Acidobacteriota bacterium]
MTSVAVESGWMGAFSPVAFTHVLKRVADEGRSGKLQVVSGNWIKTIRVDDGAVRFAESNMRRDRLGESMLAHERISKGDYRLASERMANDGCRFGEALLKMGRLNRKQLHRELGVQVQRIVLSLFRVSDGLYRFEEAETARIRDTCLPFSLSVPLLLLKGLRRVDDGRLILSALPPADTVVRMAERPVCNFDLSKLASLERSVLEKAGSGTTIGAIVRDAALERSAALRACYALVTLGLLEIADVGEDPEPEAAPEPVEAELVAESPPVEEEEDPAEGIARTNRIQQLERDAKLHLHVKDWDGATSLLHELVALAPANASYQLMLGQAMQFHPTLEKAAEAHFLQAVTLAPNDAHAHVALGRYYQRTKKHARATTELERTLEIDPRNEDARRYLDKGHRPTRMSKLVKKIFG